MTSLAARGVETGPWLVVLLPDQLRMGRLEPGDEPKHRGWTATLLLFCGLWAMVAKA